MHRLAALILATVLSATALAQRPGTPDWRALESETMQHFQALLRLDTSNPPGNEKLATDYLQRVLEREGIAARVFARDPNRPNLVARIKGNGGKRPLLLMGHTDVVTVDPKKWTFPPFSATRNGGYVYGRGTVDDKDNVVASLMTMVTLKRMSVPLKRDVIFLAEAGEEGTTRVGIDYMVQKHFPAIDAEFCLAEGGTVARMAGRIRYASVQSAEIDDNQRLYALMASMLRNNPQLFSLYVGYEDGSFLEMDFIDRAKPGFRASLNVDEDAVFRLVVISRTGKATAAAVTQYLSENLIQVAEVPGPTGPPRGELSSSAPSFI